MTLVTDLDPVVAKRIKHEEAAHGCLAFLFHDSERWAIKVAYLDGRTETADLCEYSATKYKVASAIRAHFANA